MPKLDRATESDFNEGRSLIAKRKWEDAAIVLRSVWKRSPFYSPVALNLATALTYSGRREEALSILAQSAQREKGAQQAAIIRKARVLSLIFINNGTFQIYQDGVNLMFAHKYRAARERFDKALEKEPDNVGILTRVGQAHVLEGDYDSAVERLRLAKRLNPFEPEIRMWLGRTLHQRGELKEAVEELRSAALELSSSELAPVWLAEAQVSLGLKSSAIQVLEEDVKREPLHVRALLTLAHLQITTEPSSDSAKDQQQLWSARKEVQLALSRLEKYSTPDSPAPMGELSIDLRPSASEVTAEATKLLRQIEDRQESEG
ncbi:MAG: tetratricopeptide repeat protein [Bdellovibrionota bacterium]